MLDGHLEFLFQSCASIVIVLHDATWASARASMEEFGRFKDGSSSHVAGTYCDQFRNQGGRWRFTHRIVRVRHADDAPLTRKVFAWT